MLTEIDWPKSRSYRTGTHYEPIQFYMDGLCQAKRFDLLLGYFSSSAINVLSLGFAKFLYCGGTVRLITNHILSDKDKEAVRKSAELNGDPNQLIDIKDIRNLQQTLDEYGQHFFECLAWLLANGRIELKVIKPKDGKGIAHYKSGAFFDGQNTAVFKASCNFTAYGLLENAEELECHLSWDLGAQNRIEDQTEYFESIFSGNATHVDYLNVGDIQEAVKNEFGDKTIDELLVQEKDLIEKKSKAFSNTKLKRKLEKLQEAIEEIDNVPKFPYHDGPREYQQVALEKWKNNRQCGLFAMATGTGKTITALNCLLEIYKRTGYYKAVILVPTITLVDQWENECKKFNFKSITKVYSKVQWEKDIASIVTREKLVSTEEVSYIIISTYASFSRERTFTELNQLSPKTLLVADECHNMGSNRLMKLLPKIRYQRRIGLSATPRRQYDEEGNIILSSFFNSVNEYTYEYSMKEAIDNGALCRYYYYPHLVSLTETEMTEYMVLSNKISKFYNSDSERFSNNPMLTALLLRRKRIVHKAANKLGLFCEILETEFARKGHLKYTLVYVPEGNDPNDYFETDIYSEKDEMDIDQDSVHLIDVFTKAVKSIGERITTKKFISGTEDKEEVLQQFAKGEIDVLTSMKCLDEGVDVPRSELAVFCASTGNPRQFVQRRGRILRKHKDKKFAYIHDLVVIPHVTTDSASYNMERNMLKKELQRVKDFSSLSENSSYTLDILLETMNYYNLNLYNNE